MKRKLLSRTVAYLVGILCLHIFAVTVLAASASTDQKFKKIYLDEKYSIEELEVKFGQWENLMRQLFIKRRPS